MKSLITLGLILAFVLAPMPVRRSQAQQIAPACYEAALAVVVGGVLIYGLVKMCQALPANDNPPQDTPQGMELPPPGGMYIIRVLPKLSVGVAMIENGILDIQHQDNPRAPWQTDYRFRATPFASGTASMVAYDSNGIPLVTNTAPLVSYGGEGWAYFDFTALPASATNNPTQRFFRMAVAQ
jgi:hypothetical protein